MRTFFYCYRHFRRSGLNCSQAAKRAAYVARNGF
jgi:hypothetical protein